MALPKVNPSQTVAWQNIKSHFEKMQATSMKDLFASDANRAEKFHIQWNDFLVDYSKNIVSQETLDLLLNLANEVELKQAISSYFQGDLINQTENRAVLHTALRAKESANVLVDGVNVMPEVYSVKNKIKNFSNEVISGNKKGFTGKPFTDIVNIGIGGSDLGPVMVTEALKSYKTRLNLHFVSNIDPTEVRSVLRECNPETTLVVLCSKSFSTAETLSNGRIIAQWISDAVGAKNASKHFAVVSVFPEKAVSAGLPADYVFPMWSWVGGRYSISSAVNLVNVIAFGSSAYNSMLSGMRSMDEHFMTAPLHRNVPVLMGLLNVWNRSILGRETRAMIAYSTALKSFASYVQQLEMESNGKRVTTAGDLVSIPTSPIVWGGVGTNAQHAYMQLLHQGTSVVPADFIGVAATPTHDGGAHDALVANLFAQTQALAFGNATDPHRTLPGNRPTTTLMLSSLTPRTLGALIALYEHSVFVQGCVFGINSFDQWGVELGKKLAHNISQQIALGTPSSDQDASTSQLLQWYLKHQ